MATRPTPEVWSERPIFGTTGGTVTMLAAENGFDVMVEVNGQTHVVATGATWEDAADAYAHPFARPETPNVFARRTDEDELPEWGRNMLAHVEEFTVSQDDEDETDAGTCV